MRRSVKQVTEELDDSRAEFDSLRNRAREIYDQAKFEEREFSTLEKREFDRITNKPNGLIVALRTRIQLLEEELEQE
jgi:hypothetical protein